MTSGVGVSEASGVANQRLTAHALVSVAVAASGGALFGYDLGVTGGVSTSDPFLEEFFPAVLERKRAAAAAATAAAPSPYCTYDSHLLPLFTSSAFLAAALTTLFVAGATTRRAGRRFSLRLSGALFCLGIGLAAGAANLGMLIAGRLLIGVAIGFANQAVPLFLSEVAPTRLRGAVNVSRAGKFFPVGETTTRTGGKKGSTLRPPFFFLFVSKTNQVSFQLCTTGCILLSQLVNFAALGPGKPAWGWRLSVGLAGVPALVLLFGSLFLLRDTPSSLAGRGLLAEGRAELERLRGRNRGGGQRRGWGGKAAAPAGERAESESDDDLEREWETIASAAAEATATAGGGGGARGESGSGSSDSRSGCSSFLLMMKEDLSSLAALFERRALPATVVGVGIAALSQVCGINAILFFAAPFFSSLSAGEEGAGGKNSGLLSAVVVGLALFGFTLVALALVDRVGRRALLLVGGGLMLASELSLAGLLGFFLGGSRSSPSAARLLPRGPAAGALFLMCCFVAAFASSLGPLGWLVPTEVFSARDRSAGQALATAVNFLFVFVTTQFFLASLCAMRHWSFVASSAAVVVLLLFAQFLMPVREGERERERERETEFFFFRRRRGSPTVLSGKEISQPSSTSRTPNFFLFSLSNQKQNETGDQGGPHRSRLGAVEGPSGLVEARRQSSSGRGGRKRGRSGPERRRRGRRKGRSAAEEGERRLRKVGVVFSLPRFLFSNGRYCRAKNQPRSLFFSSYKADRGK